MAQGVWSVELGSGFGIWEVSAVLHEGRERCKDDKTLVTRNEHGAVFLISLLNILDDRRLERMG